MLRPRRAKPILTHHLARRDSNQDGSVTGVSEDNSDSVYSFFAGYQLSEYLAIEGGYTDFGESTFAGTSSGGPSCVGIMIF